MLYKNSDARAVVAMEIDRLGEYPESECNEMCPICGRYNPDYFFLDMYNDCVGCSDCIKRQDSLNYF